MQIQNIKEWLSDQSNKPQFKILNKNKFEKITQIKRLKDEWILSVGEVYNDENHSNLCIAFMIFHDDLIHVEYDIYLDKDLKQNKRIYCEINSIYMTEDFSKYKYMIEKI